jgi:hypothetical protein
MSNMSPYIIALIAEAMSYDLNEAGPRKNITKGVREKILDILIHHPGEWSNAEIAELIGGASPAAVGKVIQDLHDDPNNAHLWRTARDVPGTVYHSPGESDTDFLRGSEEMKMDDKPKRWRWPQGPPMPEPDPERERAYGPMPELYGQDPEGVEYDDSMWDMIDQYDSDEPELAATPAQPSAPSFRPRRGDSQARFSSFADRVRGRSPKTESFRRSLKKMMLESYDW